MSWDHKQNRHERGYGSRWEKLRAAVLRRDNHLCQVCLQQGRVTPATEVDHVVPKARGGKDEAINCQAICSPCHKRKTAIDDKTGRVTGCDVSGKPIDPSHHWNHQE